MWGSISWRVVVLVRAKQLGHDIDGEVAYGKSGDYVSLSADGEIIAIGSPYNDDNVMGMTQGM